MNITVAFDTGYNLIIDLFDNDFVKRWAKLLRYELECNTLLVEDTYSSFCSESYARKSLEQAIDQVNDFLKVQYIAPPVEADYSNPNFYNQLHEKFEKLTGPDWNSPTRLVTLAPDHVRLAIRHINRYCHRLEHQPYRVLNYMRVEFNTSQRRLLEPQDIKLFKKIDQPNTVVLDYATLGKSLYECFEDGLDADYPAMKIQQHYSANFILQFEPRQWNPAFTAWCHDQCINDIPAVETGQLPLGKIRNSDCFEEVKKTAKILTITLE